MIDIHTHLWPAHQSPDYMADYLKKKKEAGQEISLTGPGLLRSMDHCQIHRAVISVLAFDNQMSNSDLAPLHDYVEAQIDQSQGRLAAFCTVQPFREDTFDTMTSLLEKPCFRGLKLHPNIQCFYADDQRVYPFYQWLEEHRYPVLFNTGGIWLYGIRE